MTKYLRRVSLVLAITCLASIGLRAHDGPPYPIVSDRSAHGYVISIWTDPDATDDGTAEGKFWVMLTGASGGESAIPEQTVVRLTIAPTDREGTPVTAVASPVSGRVARQYAALVMSHEGPFRVTVDVAGPLGPARIESDVDATYDTRPAPMMLVVYALPFVAVGALWMRVLWRRRRPRRTP